MPRRTKQRKVPAETAEHLSVATPTDAAPEEQFHFFWKSGSPFSQWHTSQYELNGFLYSCAEQGMMHGKALLFEDYETAAKILQTPSPRAMKALGRKVRNFDEKVWKKNRERIVFENSVAKFTQNPGMLKALMNTNGLLVEASPSDAIWGIGLVEANARNMCHKNWPGLNLLGKILTQVREAIRAGIYDELLPRKS